MNAVEIEEAVSKLVARPFDPNEFPFAFLKAFGNKRTTIKRLRAGSTNRSDVAGVLQRNNIHIKVSPMGEAASALNDLKSSPETARARAKFVLATDGCEFHAENLENGEIVVCEYPDVHEHFGFFLPLAGITTVRQIRENAFDIKATGRLNKLYLELLRANPELEAASRRQEMNQFLARLIFCFFAEDTDLFPSQAQFTPIIDQMSMRDGSNTHYVLNELFRAMMTPFVERVVAGLPRWSKGFPYVNGGLFSGSPQAPRFSRIARSYLINIGNLDWKKINPDIFGSMVQAVVVKEQRGNLGMHYTSVPNILKVLNPLFLDDLRKSLEDAGNNGRKLLNLRNRISRIRVFDPACGSGNFLVIAYREMREIEAEINRRRGEPGRKSDIPISNFRGIEISAFSAEVARLALVIAEYQCNVNYRGQREAVAEVLPLDRENWITCANALQIDWRSVCPPAGSDVRLFSGDVFQAPNEKESVDFANEGGETYVCGNPPYLGSQTQSIEQKADLKGVFEGRTNKWKSLDYVTGWFLKAADYGARSKAESAFVATNSVCQGRQVPTLWPLIFETGHKISFAHTSFKWANLASHNAGVTVAIIGISASPNATRRLYSVEPDGNTTVRAVKRINPYLVAGPDVLVRARRKPIAALPTMRFGNMPNDGGNLLLTREEVGRLGLTSAQESRLVRRIYGSREFIRGETRFCLWIKDSDIEGALSNSRIRERVENVRAYRLKSRSQQTNFAAQRAHQFFQMNVGVDSTKIIIPRHSSESRNYLPVGLLPPGTVISDSASAVCDAPLWNIALIASRLHLIWIDTVCGKLKTDFRYSNTLGWNTFPVPVLTAKNRADLTVCAENILLAREAHFPATIAELYAAEGMPENLRSAHDSNDEVLERIYIGRRFRNDTERRETLLKLYSEMITQTNK